MGPLSVAARPQSAQHENARIRRPPRYSEDYGIARRMTRRPRWTTSGRAVRAEPAERPSDVAQRATVGV